MNFLAVIGRLWGDRDGATAVEYGLIAAMISVVMLVALSAVGIELNNTFAFIGVTLDNA